MARNNKRVEGDIEKWGVKVSVLWGVVEIIADIFLEVVLTIMNLLLIINNYFNITVVTMKWIEHNFISRQLVVNEKYKKFVIF